MAKKPKSVLFCGACCVTYSMRRKRCSCGNENLGETKQPATLECGHCGDVAIESATGMFCEDDADACASCGMPGHVSVDDDYAYWSVEDYDTAAKCKQPNCEECLLP